MRKTLKTLVRPTRAHFTVPAALIGTLAATLVATPAEAAPMTLEREPRPQWRGVPATPPVTTHVVGAGESVWSIATAHGLRPADVLAWNGLDWSSVIRPGQVLSLTAPAAPAPAAPAPAAPTMMSHTVAAGDTLTGIAQRHGIGLRALFEANGLGWNSVIYPGQTLNVPGVTAAAVVTPVAAPAPVPAPTPVAPQTTHTVARGDTLSGIATQYGVSLSALFSANGLGSGSIIYPGQAIVVPGAVAAPAVVAAPAASVDGLDAEQIENARLIIQIGRELGISDRGIAIALATAMVESWIRNLDWGDRDSLGLYQQRPSTGWGSPAEIRDASRSIRVFYGGASDPNGNRTRGLLDVQGWEGMGFAQAAQAVQRSAFPDRYAAWEGAAYQWIAALG